MVRIVQKDDKDGKVLREISKEVLNIDDNIKDIVKRMKEAMDSQSDGVAIAAPQIGELVRIFLISDKVYHAFENIDHRHTVFINPEIIKISKDKKKLDEGCLSCRPWYGKVKRASRVTVRAQDLDGNTFEMEGTGLIAQIFQHEIDHLDGILFVDKAKDLKEIPEVMEQ